jgi:hypothetical protein
MRSGRPGRPHVFFTAVGGSLTHDLAGFVETLAASDLPASALAADFAEPRTWDAAFGLLAQVLPADSPSVVVLDEMPYLVREDPTFEGSLQKSFDRTLSRLPVLLIRIGSDLGMMEQLNTYGRPFYQRGTEMIVPPLNPAEVGSMLGLSAADTFDAYPVIGSYWTRTNDPEIDVVGGDRSPVAGRITAVGSIKWHDEAPFDAHDLARLTYHRDRLPGAAPDTKLLAVSRTGCAVDGLPVIAPTELINAWPN